MPPQVETARGTVYGCHIGGSRGLSKSEDSRSLTLKLAQACYGPPSALIKVDESLLRSISEDHPCSCDNHILYSRAWLSNLWLWKPEILGTPQARLCPEFPGVRLKSYQDRGTWRWRRRQRNFTRLRTVMLCQYKGKEEIQLRNRQHRTLAAVADQPTENEPA
jgi:hypothetical protein